MIRLEVQDYCHECRLFEAHVKGPRVAAYLFNGDEVVVDDVIITCMNQNKCRSIKNYLERTLKGEKV